MTADPLHQLLGESIAGLAPGGYAVAVSGGADSVALLRALLLRDDLRLHIVHLDHQTRHGASAEDARFVAELARSFHLPATIMLRETIEREMLGHDINSLQVNLSSRYRAARLALFHRIVREHSLIGVILAHHRDDQAETVLLRLLRGSSVRGLTGMKSVAELDELKLFRPLLGLSRDDLREWLRRIGQPWREDASNESDDYRRNRVRKLLARYPEISQAALELGRASADYQAWIESQSPMLAARFRAKTLADLPLPIARQSAGKWLGDAGVPGDRLLSDTLQRLIEMARDAASPARQDFPGGVCVRRREGFIWRENLAEK